ncbi:DMT family transporter, partial [Anaerolineae bacterium CFX9]|nr:DMT family transporter [Anaerolineae bacterium CFX9]
MRPRLLLHDPRVTGVLAVFATPVFLGMAPIFGKLALQTGADSFAVAAIRTAIAAVILWALYAVFARRYIYIYPAGLLGCIIVGLINAIGSLMYYGGLGMLDASLSQLINGMYLPFALLLARLGGERIDRRTAIRVGLAVLALGLITGFGDQPLNWLGVGLMLGNAIMFAGTVILSQHVLYEMPAPTATLYIVTTMAIVVLMVWSAVGTPLPQATLDAALPPILLLGITTALSRLAMFASVRMLGSIRTAVIAMLEIGVALTLAFIFLGDRLTLPQVLGVGVLGLSLLLVRAKDLVPRSLNINTLIVRDMASLQFQRIAFHRAFGTKELDNEYGVMGKITTLEMQAIAKMMGA